MKMYKKNWKDNIENSNNNRNKIKMNQRNYEEIKVEQFLQDFK